MKKVNLKSRLVLSVASVCLYSVCQDVAWGSAAWTAEEETRKQGLLGARTTELSPKEQLITQMEAIVERKNDLEIRISKIEEAHRQIDPLQSFTTESYEKYLEEVKTLERLRDQVTVCSNKIEELKRGVQELESSDGAYQAASTSSSSPASSSAPVRIHGPYKGDPLYPANKFRDNIKDARSGISWELTKECHLNRAMIAEIFHQKNMNAENFDLITNNLLDHVEYLVTGKTFTGLVSSLIPAKIGGLISDRLASGQSRHDVVAAALLCIAQSESERAKRLVEVIKSKSYEGTVGSLKHFDGKTMPAGVFIHNETIQKLKDILHSSYPVTDIVHAQLLLQLDIINCTTGYIMRTQKGDNESGLRVLMHAEPRTLAGELTEKNMYGRLARATFVTHLTNASYYAEGGSIENAAYYESMRHGVGLDDKGIDGQVKALEAAIKSIENCNTAENFDEIRDALIPSGVFKGEESWEIDQTTFDYITASNVMFGKEAFQERVNALAAKLINIESFRPNTLRSLKADFMSVMGELKNELNEYYGVKHKWKIKLENWLNHNSNTRGQDLEVLATIARPDRPEHFGMAVVRKKDNSEVFIVVKGSVLGSGDFTQINFKASGKIGTEDLSGVEMHSGFFNAASTESDMIKKVVEFVLAQNKDASIHCSGHSLGGAAATIIGLSVHDYFERMGRPLSQDQLKIFGIASAMPLVKSSELDARIEKIGLQNMIYVDTYCDIVPVVTFARGYDRIGTHLIMPTKLKNSGFIIGDHFMESAYIPYMAKTMGHVSKLVNIMRRLDRPDANMTDKDFSDLQRGWADIKKHMEDVKN